jgi:hypothetical protein
MWKPIYQPEPWPQFVKRKDIIALPLMEQRKKFMQETILFENYLSTLNTVNTVNSSVASAAAAGGGGPAPSTGGGGGGGGGLDGWDVAFTIDTNYSYTGDWPSTFGDSSQPGFPSTTVNLVNNTYNGGGGLPLYTNAAGGEITVDWGDGTEETLTSYNFEFNWANYSAYQKPGTFQHSYATDGQYQIKVKGPGASKVKFAFMPLVSVEKLDTATHDLHGMFGYTRTTPGTINLPNWVLKNATPEAMTLLSPSGFQGPTVTNLGLPSSEWGVNATGLDTWDLSGIDGTGNTSYDRAYQFLAFSPSSNDLSSWDMSGVKSISAFFKKGGNPATSGFWNWDLGSLSDLAQLAGPFESIAGEVTVPQLWDGWVFATSGITFYQSYFNNMLTGASVTNEDVLKNWIISIANDVNTPNNGILDGTLIAPSLIVNGITTDFPTLNLSADPNVSSAISTLTGKGWTIANF